MKRLTALLLMLILAAGCCGAGTAEGADTGAEPEETVMRLPDSVLMTFYDGSMFVGDSQIAKFRNFVKVKRKADPDYFTGIDFRAENSYKFRFVAYKTIPSGEMKFAHLIDEGKKVTLYTLAGKVKPKRIFVLAGINDALTTDYKNENGVERAVRYVRGMAELVREASPETEIFVISQMPVTKSFAQGSNNYKKCRDRFDAVNEAVRAECETLGIRYVDLASGLKDGNGLLPGKYCADGLVHLNDAGYEVFARELLDFAQAEYEAGRWAPDRTADGEE